MGGAPVIWFTGLSGAGKSTLAESLRARLETEGFRVTMLDGDVVRETLHRHLGFSAADIRENNALIAEHCACRRDDADVILVPIISPFADSRASARRRLGESFHEVYVKADLATVVRRDVKGLYTKAARSEIDNLIGVATDVPYEPPLSPELVLDTDTESATQSQAALYEYVRPLLPGRPPGGGQ